MLVTKKTAIRLLLWFAAAFSFLVTTVVTGWSGISNRTIEDIFEAHGWKGPMIELIPIALLAVCIVFAILLLDIAFQWIRLRFFAKTPLAKIGEDFAFVDLQLELGVSESGNRIGTLHLKSRDVAISGIRVRVQTNSAERTELAPLQNTLAPRSELSIQLLPKFLPGGAAYERVSTQISYVAIVDAREQVFTALMEFTVGTETKNTGFFNPSRSNHMAGESLDPNQDNALLRGLSTEAGTLFLVFDELARDGNPNRIIAVTPDRALSISLRDRVATFQCKTASRRDVWLSIPIETEPSNRHILTLIWNRGGARLKVGANQAADFDEGSDPDAAVAS